MVGDFTHDQSISQKLMAGFVECLDCEDAEEFVRLEEGSDLERKLVAIRYETRIHILNLLITSLECNPPNLALYLLGFELKKPVSTTNLQDPGVLGCPRTCLHAILNILEKGTEGEQAQWQCENLLNWLSYVIRSYISYVHALIRLVLL